MTDSNLNPATGAENTGQEATPGATDEITQLRNELNDARERLLRAQAEMDNVRKRLRREMDEERRFATMPLLSDLLPVVDNLGRAIEAAEKAAAADQGDVNSLLEGVRMVAQQFETVLENHGCKRIAALNEPFNPDVHNAVMLQPSTDVPPGTVMMVTQDGYQLHDRVVRPSQVIVSTAVEGAGEANPG